MAGYPKASSSRQGVSQNVAFAASGGASAAVTNPFGTETYQIMLTVSGTGFVAGTGGVRVRIDSGTPTATATDTFIPTGVIAYFTVTPGQKVAVIGNDAGVGNLSVTELS